MAKTITATLIALIIVNVASPRNPARYAPTLNAPQATATEPLR